MRRHRDRGRARTAQLIGVAGVAASLGGLIGRQLGRSHAPAAPDNPAKVPKAAKKKGKKAKRKAAAVA